jgi:hypothetical protein
MSLRRPVNSTPILRSRQILVPALAVEWQYVDVIPQCCSQDVVLVVQGPKRRLGLLHQELRGVRGESLRSETARRRL